MKMTVSGIPESFHTEISCNVFQLLKLLSQTLLKQRLNVSMDFFLSQMGWKGGILE